MASPLAHLSIRQRVWSIVAMLVLAIGFLGAMHLRAVRTMLWQEKENHTRELVESALGVVSHFHALQARGEMGEAAARAAALGTLRNMRYDGREYFWINDLGVPFPRMVMHPTHPELEGRVMDEGRFDTATTIRGASQRRFTPVTDQRNLFVNVV